MNIKEKRNEILSFWDERAKLKNKAGTNDLIAKQIEMDAIIKYIKDGMRILDIGCGSGNTAVEIAKHCDSDITGFDFSEEMIKEANLLAKETKTKGMVSFFQGNVLEMPEVTDFDIIYTERVLINLNDWNEQKNAIVNIMEKLKPGGKYIMCENCIEGLDSINKLRELLDLEAITSPWHNRYLVMNEIDSLKIPGATLKQVDHITSTYAFLSRIVNAAVAEHEGLQPDYNSFINQLALKLPMIGDLGQTKIWLWEKD